MSNEQKGNEFENMQLGEIAVKLGYITQEQLDSLLNEYEKSIASSRYLIGELLVQKNLLNKKQLKHILALQNRIMLNCEYCHKKFSIKNYDPNRNYKCPHCSGRLILPPSDTQRMAKKKKNSSNLPKPKDQSEALSQDGDMLISSNISEIAKGAFSMTDEPFERYSEFLRSFSEDKDEETREVREIIDTNSEEIVVLADEEDDFEAEFSVNDPEDYSDVFPGRNKESSIAQVDDSFVVGTATNFYQSGISVLKMLEEERGVHANVDLSTDPQTERHLKKLKRIDSVSKYIVYDEVGRGGMGVVKLSYDQDIRRQIATKIIHPTSKEVPSKQERFLEEAQITGQLEHPNIVPVHDLGIDTDGNLFFTMKLVKGKSLLDVIEFVADKKDGYHKYFTVTRFLQIFMKICDAVAFAHSKGVLHRDLKPENIMVGDYGEVMVMDWGLAKVKGLPDKRVDQVSTDRSVGKIHQTMDGSIVGTPGYMAPEQARGDLEDVNEQSDIYSLGAILYEILTYKQAFPGSDSSKVIQKVKRHKFLPPSIAAPSMNIPRELEHVVLNAMAFKPEERYLTVNQLKEEIEAYIDGRVLSSVNYSMIQLFTKWFMRNMTTLIIAFVFVVAFLTMAVFWANDLTDERDDAIASSVELKNDNSNLSKEIQRIKDTADKDKKSAKSRHIIGSVQNAIMNNDVDKLKALKNAADPKYGQLIDYYIATKENRIITKTPKTFYDNVKMTKSLDEDVVVVVSGNVMNIYENLNNNFTSSINLKAVPTNLAVSEDGTIIVVTFDTDEYQVINLYGTMLTESKTSISNVSGVYVSTLSNYLIFSNADGATEIIGWKENVSKTVELEGKKIVSNIQFLSDSEICYSLDNKDFAISTWDKELNSIETKFLKSNTTYSKIFVSGTNTILIDSKRKVSRFNTSRLQNAESLSDVSVDRQIRIRQEQYDFDIESNYLWELSENRLVCRDLKSGNVLKTFLMPTSSNITWNEILKVKGEIFMISSNGILYKLGNDHYKDIPLYIGIDYEPLKMWNYRNKNYMLTPSGIYNFNSNSITLLEKTSCTDNVVKSFDYIEDGILFMSHVNGQVSCYNLYSNSFNVINEFAMPDATIIKAVKASSSDAQYLLMTLDSLQNLSCIAVNTSWNAAKLWEMKVKYKESSKIAVLAETNTVYVMEYNNQINTYDLVSGNIKKELMLSHMAVEIFLINSGKTLLTVDSKNVVRVIAFETMATLYSYNNSHLTGIRDCYVDNSSTWLVTIGDSEINLRTFADNQNVLTFRNFENWNSVFIDSANQFIYYIDRDTHTLESLSLLELYKIFNK